MQCLAMNSYCVNMQEDTICIRAGKIILKTPPVSYKRDSLRLGISIAAPLIAGVIGSIFTSESVSTWYQTIEKPSFNPPNWLFGPVWTMLYVMMGISLFLVWRATSTATFHEDRRSRKELAAFIAFGTQLILNVLWSFLFFGLRSPQLAFAEIMILLISIVMTIVIFSKISKLAAVLMLPYAGWVTFASFLNLQIWLVNSS